MFAHAHGFALCGHPPGGPALVLAMGLAGLAGSALHCGPMCGGFVIGQMTDRLALVPAMRLCALTRLRAALLLPYHLGRLTTYAGLGAASAAVGALALRLGPAPGMLLGVAASLCAVNGCRRLGLLPGAGRVSAAAGVSAWLGRAGARLDRSRASGGFLLGVLLGFLPCGLLYAALAAAAASASPGWGAAAMLAFGLGTVPALVLMGLAGTLAAGGRRLLAGRAGGALMLLNSVLLWRLALAA